MVRSLADRTFQLRSRQVDNHYRWGFATGPKLGVVTRSARTLIARFFLRKCPKPDADDPTDLCDSPPGTKVPKRCLLDKLVVDPLGKLGELGKKTVTEPLEGLVHNISTIVKDPLHNLDKSMGLLVSSIPHFSPVNQVGKNVMDFGKRGSKAADPLKIIKESLGMKHCGGDCFAQREQCLSCKFVLMSTSTEETRVDVAKRMDECLNSETTAC